MTATVRNISTARRITAERFIDALLDAARISGHSPRVVADGIADGRVSLAEVAAVLGEEVPTADVAEIITRALRLLVAS